MFVLPERDSFGRRVIFHIPRCKKSPLFKVLKATIRHLDPSRHSMEDVIKVIAITLETLLEDEENQIRYLVVLTWFPEPFHHPGDSFALWTPANSPWLIWLSGTRSRCDPVSNNSTLPIFQLRRVINLCEKGIPMRHKGVNYIHLPSFVTTMFNFVKGILSKKIQNRSKYWLKYKQIKT